MKRLLTPLAIGTLFGAGLAVAQMTNPAKVLGFLDVSGAWDPSLAFVMGAALIVSAVAVQVDKIARTRAGLAVIPQGSIDRDVVVGASLFGAGWGLAGFCPGPAIASLATGSGQVVLFVSSMLVGMGLFRLVSRTASTSKGSTRPGQPAVS